MVPASGGAADTWALFGGAAANVGSGVMTFTAGTHAGAVDNTTTSVADQRVGAKIVAIVTHAELYFRYSSSTDMGLVLLDAIGGITVFSKIGGSFTLRGTAASGSFALGDTVTVDCPAGTSCTVYVNGVAVAALTNVACGGIPSTGKPGLGCENGATFDNFLFETLGASAGGSSPIANSPCGPIWTLPRRGIASPSLTPGVR